MEKGTDMAQSVPGIAKQVSDQPHCTMMLCIMAATSGGSYKMLPTNSLAAAPPIPLCR